MNSDGTNQRRLTSASDRAPNISPDGTRIAFFNYNRTGSYNAEIYVMNIDGSNITRLTNVPGNDYNPTFSPDGARIAFVSERNLQHDIYIMNSDGTNQTRLTSTFFYLYNVDFSPTGTRIAFADGRDTPEIYAMNPDGSNVTRLTNNQFMDEEPSFSPDGTRIAFRSNRDAGFNPEIYVMNSDGSNPTRLTNNQGYSENPSFSPDGAHIAFSRPGGMFGKGQIYSMNADGSNQTNLTNDIFNSAAEPDWGALAAPGPLTLWAAGRDLLANEKPDAAKESIATNTTVPEWSYGYRTTAASTALTLFPPGIHVNNADGSEGWSGAAEGILFVNTKSEPIILNGGFGNLKPLYPAQVLMHPSSGNNFIVARWTAPADGAYRFVAKWVDLDNHGGNGATAHLVVNGKEEFTETFVSTSVRNGKARLRAKTFNDMKAGDLVDFLVGSNGDNTFDTTAFNAVVVRVPTVAITSPAPGTTFNADQDIAVGVQVGPVEPVEKVQLRVDGKKVGVADTQAPYAFTVQVKSGTHFITVEVTDSRRLKTTSAPVEILVSEAGSSQAAAATRTGEGASDSTAASSGGKIFYSANSGRWVEPSTWGDGSSGVPGPDDHAIVKKGHDVSLDRNTEVKNLNVNGRLAGEGVSTILTVGGNLYANSEIASLTLVIGDHGKFLNIAGFAILNFVSLLNYGEVTIFDGVGGVGSTFDNRGQLTVGPLPGLDQLVKPSFDNFTNKGTAFVTPNGQLNTKHSELVSGNIALSPAISENGAGLIGNDSAGLIGNGDVYVGGSLVGNDGASLIGLDGATLVGNDGASIIGPIGVPLVGLDGGSLIGNDGGTIAGSGNPPTVTEGPELDNASQAATASGDIILTGGTVTGTGELRGNVVNKGAFILPGRSAGGILINGNYTQESAATLLLEIGGTKTTPLQYDIFQVTGTANLGGNLIVRTIDGYTPASGDVLSPLLYTSHTGSFDNVSSNAQISFGANGAQVTVSGPNPPAPKALNIATRMRVETGDNVLIAGFIITGSQPKKVIIRGIGPSLPLPGALADPTLELDAGAVTNDDWRTNQEQEIIATTIPPSSNLESAIVATLDPGLHTAILRGKDGTTGIGVVEVYDLDSGAPSTLANISSRGFVQTDDNVMIGGFIIGGNYPAKVLIRAIGPSLAAFGLQGALEDTELELHDSNGSTITNDDWRSTQEAEITLTTIPPSNDKESAILAILTPGNYTAVVRGKNNTTGIAVVEAYNIQ